MNEQTQKTPMLLTGLTWLSVIVFLVSMYMGLVYAPTEAIMGAVQRVFYYHVATNWVGAVAFAVTVVTGIIYLINRGRIWDRISLASVEVGLIFLIVGTVTGSIWGRPVWNTWWTWDPRLTASLVMMLTFIGVLLLRGAVNDPNRRATWTGVATIVAYLNIPITYMSVRWWASMHQQQSTPATMNDEMKFVMRMCAWAFLLIGIWFMARRWRLAKMTAEAEMPEPLTIGQSAQEAR